MNINNAYILEDRGILFIEGKDAEDFLQNIISNDIKKVSETNSCFASLLSPQGKFLYEFLIIKHKNGYFLDCEKNQIEGLYKQLSFYKLRSEIQILNLSNEFVVASLNYDKFKSLKNVKDELGFTTKIEEDKILLDPRNKNLGARLVINLEKLYLSLKKLELKSSKPEEYYELSFKMGIAQKNTDKLKDKIFGIECNFEELNAIDFKKGCFIGQENTSRIKLRNKLKKRLMAIDVKEGKVLENDGIKFNESEIGKMLICEPFPFALIKTDNPDINEFLDKELNCGSAKVKIIKPEWLKL